LLKKITGRRKEMATLLDNRQAKIEIDILRLRRILDKILKHLNLEDSEISFLFVDDEDIKKINHQYLNRDYPTNVIAFSMREGEFGDVNPHILGDVVISVETALRDAKKENIRFEDGLDYLMIHGILHLLGYDHEKSEIESRKMKEKEKEIFFEIKKYVIE
jgi:probable rRNA maturation factor